MLLGEFDAHSSEGFFAFSGFDRVVFPFLVFDPGQSFDTPLVIVLFYLSVLLLHLLKFASAVFPLAQFLNVAGFVSLFRLVNPRSSTLRLVHRLEDLGFFLSEQANPVFYLLLVV